MAERVVVAMSGGVDSSVAAALLCAQGYDVVGATLHLWDYPDDGSVKSRCCAPEDIHDARRVSDKLGIAHYAFDRRELFAQTVVQPFVDAYLRGETPSPCVSCNRGVKIKELLGLADRLGATYVATGHYARLVQGAAGVELHRARDLNKDQSYFLHMLGQTTLQRLLFPLGELDKAAVRAEAVRLDLPGAHKGESQELCFVSSGRYDSFVAERAGDRVRPGPILNEQGQVVGEHRGIHTVTLGQRRNLGVAVGQRAYVTSIDEQSGVVRLGPRDELLAAGALIKDSTLASGVKVPLGCEVAVRYRGRAVPARVEAQGNDPSQGNDLVVRFEEPTHAVVPGQVAVFYSGSRVLGGGTIDRALRASVDKVAAAGEPLGANA